MNNIDEIAQKFKSYASVDEKMSEHTSFKIGGNARLFVSPGNVEELCAVMDAVRKSGERFFVLGGGTNVVFADEGFDGIVVSTAKLESGISISRDGCQLQEDPYSEDTAPCPLHPERSVLSCAAGTAISALVNFSAENEMTGLEEFVGLPGTVGGAAYMNARCFEKEISDVVQKISWIEYDGKKYTQREGVFSKDEWSYKKSPFTNSDKIITRVDFVVQAADDSDRDAAKEAIAKKCRDIVRQRREKGHYEYPCAGSVFKNNRDFGEPSGKIIDSCGLRGQSRGGAQIAPFHANIIINTGGAACADVRALVDLMKREVKAKRGFDLEEEIIFA